MTTTDTTAKVNGLDPLGPRRGMNIQGAREARAVGCQSATSPSTVQDDVPGQRAHLSVAPLLVHAQARLRRTPSASTPARRSTRRTCGG
jgi:hypothetical protein